MKISVITVCRNAIDCLEDTINSVLAQDFVGLEYIIIDGESTDGSIEILEKYKNKVKLILSEPDSGIFDAMNKGVKYASGEYVIFMNAGDAFASIDIVRKISEYLTDDVSVLYGNTRFVGKSTNFVRLPRKNFYFGLPFCHQSCVTKRSELLSFPFILNNIYADYDFYSNLFNSASKFLYIDAIISNYRLGGISERATLNNIFQIVQICKRNFGWVRSLILFTFLLIRYFSKKSIIISKIRLN